MADQIIVESLQSDTVPTGRYRFFKRVAVTTVTPVTIAEFPMDEDTVAMVRFRAVGRDEAASGTYRCSQAQIRMFERIGALPPATVAPSPYELFTPVTTAGQVSFTVSGGVVTAIFTADALALPGTVTVSVEMDVLVT
jgi:hypothetical protein